MNNAAIKLQARARGAHVRKQQQHGGDEEATGGGPWWWRGELRERGEELRIKSVEKSYEIEAKIKVQYARAPTLRARTHV